MKYYWVFCLSAIGLFSSCESNKKNDDKLPEYEIGDYLYVDAKGTSHVSKDCFYIRFASSDDAGSGITRIDVDTLSSVEHISLCSECVSDDLFSILDHICKEHRAIRKDTPESNNYYNDVTAEHEGTVALEAVEVVVEE